MTYDQETSVGTFRCTVTFDLYDGKNVVYDGRNHRFLCGDNDCMAPAEKIDERPLALYLKERLSHHARSN